MPMLLSKGLAGSRHEVFSEQRNRWDADQLRPKDNTNENVNETNVYKAIDTIQ